ncbi:hypothetical protein KJ855_02950 [Patescibacteria group bacterium]|nr:hypothetical protein [Patescibacteria group bacterium]
MKNYNYNLVKMLHICLDNAWRIEKHYHDDTADLPCDCKSIMDRVRSDNEAHIELLKAELKKHSDNGDL